MRIRCFADGHVGEALPTGRCALVFTGETTMPNLVMVMPYQAYIKRAQAEGFRIHAIWDPAEADRLFGTQAAQYLRNVETLADGFRLVDFTDRAAYADA